MDLVERGAGAKQTARSNFDAGSLEDRFGHEATGEEVKGALFRLAEILAEALALR